MILLPLIPFNAALNIMVTDLEEEKVGAPVWSDSRITVVPTDKNLGRYLYDWRVQKLLSLLRSPLGGQYDLKVRNGYPTLSVRRPNNQREATDLRRMVTPPYVCLRLSSTLLGGIFMSIIFPKPLTILDPANPPSVHSGDETAPPAKPLSR